MGNRGEFRDSGVEVDLPPGSLDFNPASDNRTGPLLLSEYEGMEGFGESLASFEALQNGRFPGSMEGSGNGFGVGFHGQLEMGGVSKPANDQLSMWAALHGSRNILNHGTQLFEQAHPAGETIETDPDHTHSKHSRTGPQKQTIQRVSQDVDRAVGRRRPSNTSLSKGQTSGPSQSDEAEPMEDDGEKRREKYREKNRLAAAKCRTKKKANVNELEERHRIMAAENNIRKREERELRDQLTTLRTMALEHGPGRCKCGGLHSYNQAKATEMALGHRIGGPMHLAASSSSDDASAVISPVLMPFSAGLSRRLSSPSTSESSQLLSNGLSSRLSAQPFQGSKHASPTTADSPFFGAKVSSGSSGSEQPSETLRRHMDELNAFTDFVQSPQDAAHHL